MAVDGGRRPGSTGHGCRRANHKTPARQAFRLVSGCSPDGIRTHATALRGRRPRPLDDGAVLVEQLNGLHLATWRVAIRNQPPPPRRPRAAVAGVPGLEPRLTEPESVGLPITPYPIGAR